MNIVPATPNRGTEFLRGFLRIFHAQTGQSFVVWAVIALLNLALQIIFYRALTGAPGGQAAGEFGTLNAALGIIGLLALPLLALQQAFHLYPARLPMTEDTALLDRLRGSVLPVTETAAWIWGGACFLLILPPLPFPYLPRFSLELFVLMNVLLALGGLVSRTVCERTGQLRLWTILLLSAAVTRLVVGGALAAVEPWADAGLAAFLVAGFVTLAPALRDREIDFAARLNAIRSVFDRDFVVFAMATLSVLGGIYLFTNADRIVSLRWVNIPASRPADVIRGVLIPFVPYDCYQAAGLLGRGLLWGTQPLLWILFAQRSRLKHTNASSLIFFWIYIGALLLCAAMLVVLAQPFSRLFCGADFQSIAFWVPTFATVMVPLGLLQGLGIFSLASRRYPECFVLGGCSLLYTLVLLLFGRRPEIMLSYMFGGGLVSLMAVLFVGVVRWGRKQP